VTALAGLIRRGPSSGNWGVPIGLGAAYALGHAAVREWLRPEWPPFPPLDATDWLPWLALLAMILGLCESLAPSPFWARWENRLLLAGLTLWFLLGPQVANVWQPAEAAAWLSAFGVGALTLWGVAEHQAKRLGRGAILPLAILVAGTGGILMLLNNLHLAEFAGVLCVGLIACWLVSRWRQGLTLARGGVPLVAVLLTGLLAAGRFYSFPEMPIPALILLALAPATLWIDRIGPIRRLRPWQVGIDRCVAMLAWVGIALGVTWMQMPPGSAEGY
jgi:hypothetical protein